MRRFGENIFRFSFFSLLILILSGCTGHLTPQLRKEIKLDGKWKFTVGTNSPRIDEKWYGKTFDGVISLPGTLDEDKKALIHAGILPDSLNNHQTFVGLVWYQKEIEIPSDWQNQHIELILERTKTTKVWLDSVLVDSCSMTCSAQIFNLSKLATPGRHILTISVDNRQDFIPGEVLPENTNSMFHNWNGITGRMSIEASNKVRLGKIKVTPDIQAKTAKILVKIEGRAKAHGLVSVTIKAKSWNSKARMELPAETFIWPSDTLTKELLFTYSMGEQVKLWSEFDPSLYKLEVTLNITGVPVDNRYIDFGMREFETSGTQLSINGKTAFLRGKHDALVFPLTGYPPCEVKSWVKIFKTAKANGINHYHFQDAIPPEAAFKAADICGIYIKSELPDLRNIKADSTKALEYLTILGKQILDSYGNYASFAFFSTGNELFNNQILLQKIMTDLQRYDNRCLFEFEPLNQSQNGSYLPKDNGS